jgi:AcrR family transcriptional regulator
VERRTRGLGAEHTRRRTEIADAVLGIVADSGLGAVSLAEVAARAGISGGRVQHYFPSKQDLLEAAFDRANELASARIQAHPEAGDALGMLTVVLTELIPHDETTRLHLRVRQAFIALALVDAAIADRLRADYARLHQRLAELVATVRDSTSVVPTGDPRATAVSLVALTEGLAYYVLIGVTDATDAHDAVLTAIDELTTPHARNGRTR